MNRTFRKSKQKTCRGCGTDFTQVLNREYCSHECHKKYVRAKEAKQRRDATAKQLISKVCGQCGEQFSFQNMSGKNNVKYCSFICQRRAAMQKFTERKKQRGMCSVEGCKNRIDRVQSEMCESHYTIVRRNGSTERLEPAGRYTTSAGYVLVKNPTHPLATSNGHIGEHRAVAYEKHDGICPPCTWCGCDLSWSTCVIDHLNETKDDNSPSNLAVSCNPCNRARGAMLPFIEQMQPSAHALFLTLATQRIGKRCHDKRTARGE